MRPICRPGWRRAVGMVGFSRLVLVALGALALAAGDVPPAVAAEATPVPSIPSPPSPLPKAKAKVGTPAQDAAQCAWTGTHVVTLLAREDVVAAGEYLRFYQTFKCPDAHLAEALGCVVSNQFPAEAPARDLVERARLCWSTPSTKFLEPPAGDAGKPATQ